MATLASASAWLLAALWIGTLQARADEAASVLFGPLYSRFALTLEPVERTEVAGPLLSFEQGEEETGWTFSPLFSYRNNPGVELEEFDLLYPLLTYDRFGAEKRFQILQLISIAGGGNQADNPQSRLTLFPFYFQQRSPDPALNYTALLPFYGHLQNRLFRDEIHFTLLPLYVQTRKKDVVTDNYLLPFFHLRHGDALNGWQFWPLVGAEQKGITHRTNVVDELELVGGHEKFFALWPFFFRNTLGIGTTNVQTQNGLIPFYSSQRSPARDSTSYLWPFGFTVTVDREKNYREWGAPWPFVLAARGEGKTATRVWPLFGTARNPVLESSFFLWPLYKYNRAASTPLDRERTRILFYLYSDLTERNTETGTALRRTDLWPLFTARQGHDGSERFQMLAPLETILPNNKSIERNYSQLWSFWRSEKNRKTKSASESLLWNFYRGEMTNNATKCSLFFGLVRYQSGPDGTRWRLFRAPSDRKIQPEASTQP